MSEMSEQSRSKVGWENVGNVGAKSEQGGLGKRRSRVGARWERKWYMTEVRGFMLDNCWIIPFKSFCLLWLLCHINIKCAICFGSMKYINKYIDKGGDWYTVVP